MIFNMTGGGGANLNVTVIGGVEEPTYTASKNTIWVNTETEITGYVFSPYEPKNPTEGLVWVVCSGSRNIYNSLGSEFDALSGDISSLILCPISAMQYIEGIWVKKYAREYNGGAWFDLVLEQSIIPYKDLQPSRFWCKQNGVEETRVYTSTSGAVVFTSQHTLRAEVYYVSVDLTLFSTLSIKGSVIFKGANTTDTCNVNIGFTKTPNLIGFKSGTMNSGDTKTINSTYDISSLTGFHNLSVYLFPNASNKDTSNTISVSISSLTLK